MWLFALYIITFFILPIILMIYSFYNYQKCRNRLYLALAILCLIWILYAIAYGP